MRSCAKGSDCRAGYQCVDMALRNPWGALVVDPGTSSKVCALEPPAEAGGESSVCSLAAPGFSAPPLDAGPGGDGSTP
jgi:hypothetical protein